MPVRQFDCPRLRGWSGSATITAACLVLMLSILPSPAAAQNLLLNPDLTSDLTNWSAGANTTFDGTLGSPSPGSALWQTTLVGDDAATEYFILSQCVDGIVPGTTYTYGGQFFISTATGPGTANVVLAWQSSAGCSGFTSIDAASPVSTTGSWVSANGSAVAPAGTASVELVALGGVASFGPGPIGAGPGAVAGDYAINADSLFLQAAAVVPTMDLPWLLLLGLALGLVVVVMLTRRETAGSSMAG